MTTSKRYVIVASACAISLMALTACSDEGGSSGDDVTIHVALGGSGNNHNPPEDNPIATGIGEAIGATVIHDQEPEDLSASLAAGDSPDIFQVTRNELNTYMEQGLVLDLTPYEDQLGDYVEFVGQDTVDQGRIDDQLMAITPYQNNTNDGTYWVRQDWLDNLDMEIPTNAEEFREVLRAFTEDDPDGNGSDDTYGLTGSSPGTYKYLWGAFGTLGPGRIYADESGEIRDSYQDEGMAEAVEYIADLETSGFVDPDSYTIDGLEARDRGFQGTAGVMGVSWTAVVKEPSASLGREANPDAEWVQIDQLQQADGSPGMLPVSTDSASMYAIPSSLEGDDAKIEKIIDLINYVSTPEGNRFAMWGEEGTHYEVDEDGNIAALPVRDDFENGIFFIYLVAGREELPYLEALFPDLMDYIEVAHGQPTVTTWEEYVVPPEGYNRADADRFSEDQMVQLMTGQQPASNYQDVVDTLQGQFGYAEFVDAAREQLADVNTEN